MSKELTPKQQRFVSEYVKNKQNGTQAALVAYDTEDENTAHAIASENLRKPTVRERVDEALATLNITPEYTLNGFKKLADGSRVDMVKARALENIASIQDMYPKSNNSLEIGDGKLTLKWED